MTVVFEGWDGEWHWITEDGVPVWWVRVPPPPPKPYGAVPYFRKVDTRSVYAEYDQDGIKEVMERKK